MPNLNPSSPFHAIPARKPAAGCARMAGAMRAFAVAAALFAAVTPLRAQQQPAAETPAVAAPPVIRDDGKPTRYDSELARLSTILGSLHYLRNLCGETGDEWRGRMETILIADRMQGERRARAVAAFNDGYRAFATTYPACNALALQAIGRFQEEGARLTATLLTRYRG
jgi:uncharacterized protein (TIGR02301 family)